jgi:Ca2+-binding EF-hand superfamily protein
VCADPGSAVPQSHRRLTVRAQSWEEAFRHYDKNKNNAIDGDELEEALERFGYSLTPQLQGLLKRKYGAGLSFEHPISSARCSRLLNLDVPWPSKEGEAGEDPAADGHNAPPGITFDRFMRACVVVKQLKELFDAFDKDPNGQVKINYETFLEMVFKLP